MKITAIIIALMMITSCGGRVARPVSTETDLDARLSCAHIQGQYTSNEERIVDLEEEARFQAQQNLGRVFVGGIFFIDGNDEEEEEIAALQARNIRLTEMAEGRDCETLVNF